MPYRDSKSWIPFNIYDFFGYLFPGVLFTILILAFFLSENSISGKYISFILQLHQRLPILMTIAEIVSGIIAVYMLGNGIATLSHIIVDRIIIGTIFRYPYVTLRKPPANGVFATKE